MVEMLRPTEASEAHNPRFAQEDRFFYVGVDDPTRVALCCGLELEDLAW